MPAAGRQIHALDEKLKIIAEFAHVLGLSEGRSIRQLEKACGFSSGRLSKAGGEGRLTPETESKLAQFIEFDVQDARWCDPTVAARNRSFASSAYSGRDRAFSFRSYLADRHGLSELMHYRVQTAPPRHRDRDIATFVMDSPGQVVEADQPLKLFFSVVMKPGYQPGGLVYGFNRVRLIVKRSAEESALRLTRLLGGEGAPLTIGEAVLEARGGPFDPEWFLKIEGTILDGEYAALDDPVCEIEGGGINEELKAEIAVHQHDGSLIHRDTGNALEDAAKSAVLQALCAKHLRNDGDKQSAWLVLGEQTIRIVRGEPR